jgi:cytochrome c553
MEGHFTMTVRPAVTDDEINAEQENQGWDQKYDYLVHSLMAYKAGERKSPMMSLVVKSLSDEDMANVAAYYAAIKITVEAPP